MMPFVGLLVRSFVKPPVEVMQEEAELESWLQPLHLRADTFPGQVATGQYQRPCPYHANYGSLCEGELAGALLSAADNDEASHAHVQPDVDHTVAPHVRVHVFVRLAQ
jgi:hypothetical protein